VVQEQALPAGRQEQRIDGHDQEPHAKCVVAAIAQPHIHTDGVSRARQSRTPAPDPGTSAGAPASMQALASASRNCTVVSSAMRRLPPVTAPRVVRTPAIARKSRARLRPYRAPATRWRSAAQRERLPIKRIGVGAHAWGAGVGKLGEGERAVGGDERVAGNDVLAAGAGESHGVPVVVDGAVGAWQKKKSRLRRRSSGLRDHAAEELPLRIVAAAAKTSRTG